MSFRMNWLNFGFMMIAIGSLVFSSWKMQPCSCPGGSANPTDAVRTSGGSAIRFDGGPQETRRIRPPRKVDRSAFSGSYWAYGSWGRVIRSSSGCWAYPAHDSYAIECYRRLTSKRAEVFFDVEQLESLTTADAQVSVPVGFANAVSIGERLPSKKKARGGNNATLSWVPTVVQRYHVASRACVLGTGTFNFSCVIKVNVRYLTKQPNDSPPEVCFITIGDWGAPLKAQKTVADMIADVAEHRMVKFIVSTGDNFYPAGVQTTADPQWIQTFEIPFSAQSLTNVRWYISLGNHDQWGFQAQKQYTEDHPRWYLPEFNYADSVPLYRDAKKKGNESIELGVLNSAGRELTAQVQQLDQFFASIDRRHHGPEDRSRHWRFVVNHEPVFSGGLHGLLPERNQFVRGSIGPSLQQHMVHAYFNGDDHFLEIHRSTGTDFFTSGGGSGSELYTTTMRPTTRWNMFTDFLPKDIPALEIVIDGAQKRSSAKGAMLHCIEGGVMRTFVLDEMGAVMHHYDTFYEVDPAEFQMEIEDVTTTSAG